MTVSGWREEGLLGLADGETGLCFCPSVNHPAWFVELCLLIYSCMRAVIIFASVQQDLPAVVSDEVGQLGHREDVGASSQLQSGRVITHLAEQKKRKRTSQDYENDS